jgi:hypothetical protein
MVPCYNILRYYVPGIAVVEYKQHNVNTRKNTTSMLYLITINPILKVLANLK